ncbi:LEA type 2 family protein [Andreprevotia chitinilytica]|uniref:LEA type 2 family protein n=1 Tax=Andreprevotia chitinilytica TaxID=396808 RepID=UPI00068DEC86|nr:LEA type 2 family protein [Andreprevotia chitinilytica]
MMIRRWLVLATLLLAACMNVPDHFEKPRVSLAGIELKEVGLLEQRFVLTLRLQNPNNISIPIDGLDAELSIADKPLAQGVLRQHVTLPALGEATVPIEVTANLPALIKAWRALQQRGSYRLTGKLFVPLRPDGVPFDHTGELPMLNDVLNKLVPGSTSF